MHTTTPKADRFGALISIGTGRSPASRFTSSRVGIARYFKYFNAARNMAAEAHGTHTNVLEKNAEREMQLRYMRFDVDIGLENMKLDEWRPISRSERSGSETLETIIRATNRYLATRGVRNDLGRLASDLVGRRVLREQYADRWNEFCPEA
jgi:hypothetical protein